MKKTLYYNIVFKECGHMYNKGFLIVNINEERIKIEGVLTEDYIEAKIEQNNLVIRYYVLDEFFQKLILKYTLEIQKDQVELPINIQYELINRSIVQIITKRQIINQEIMEKYDRILKEFKERHNVFGEER